jgi:hypothetical protein
LPVPAKPNSSLEKNVGASINVCLLNIAFSNRNLL